MGSHHHPRIDLIFDFLPSIGIDVNQLKLDMRDLKINKIIDQDIADLKQLGVRATPTFFVNGKTPKAFGFNHLKNLIEEEIRRLYP